MKDLLRKIRSLEEKMERAEQQSDYWMQEEHFDMEKSNEFEAEADSIYKDLYQMSVQAADRIVRITSGKIDKAMAMTMLRERRSELERIFA